MTACERQMWARIIRVMRRNDRLATLVGKKIGWMLNLHDSGPPWPSQYGPLTPEALARAVTRIVCGHARGTEPWR